MLCEQCGNCFYFQESYGTNGELGTCTNEDSYDFDQLVDYDYSCFDFEAE